MGLLVTHGEVVIDGVVRTVQNSRLVPIAAA
jgi:hypothetical protein